MVSILEGYIFVEFSHRWLENILGIPFGMKVYASVENMSGSLYSHLELKEQRVKYQFWGIKNPPKLSLVLKSISR